MVLYYLYMRKNSILYFSDASMLAVHALTILAKKKESYMTTKEMADLLGASENHLAKVMQMLSKNKIVSSIKGPAGGFTLKADPEQISVKNVIEIIDGPLDSNFCPFFKNCRAENCILGPQIAEYSNKIIEILKNRTISEVSKKSMFIK